MTHKDPIHGLLVVLLAVGVAAFAPLSRAQPAADVETLRMDLEKLKHDVREMRKQLDELRQQPQPAPSAQRNAEVVVVSVGGGQALGNADAPVTIIEFSDYQCPFCRRHASTTLPELKKEYIDSGKVRYVYRDLPLDSIHPQARKAAEAAHCAGDQGKYWEMHDLLFVKRQLMPDHLKEHAIALGLDRVAFDACLDDGKYAKAVSEDEIAARAAGTTKTPTFFIGRTRTAGSVEGVRMVGAHPLATFQRVIDQLLGAGAGS